jgi:hypothetical protein
MTYSNGIGEILLGLLILVSAQVTVDPGDRNPQSCTIFTASIGEKVLFGNNEDYTNPNTYYWVIPPEEGKYGGVYFGFDDLWPQGGVNEMGLAFDINGLKQTPINPHPELPSFDTYEGYTVLSSCATVEEAIELVQEYNWGKSMGGQIHFVDAIGDAVIVSTGKNQELAFTRKKKGDGFLVSTNFNPAFYPEDEREGICHRYDKAVEMLEKIESEENLTIEYFKDILESVHFEGFTTNTQYSNIYDLKNGYIYLYYFHQFDEPVKINIAEEIAKKTDPVPIKTLFSEETLKKATDEHRRYQIIKYSILITIIILICLGFYAIWRRKKTRNHPTPDRK